MLDPVTISPALAVTVIALAITTGAVIGAIGYRAWLAEMAAARPAWWPITPAPAAGRHHFNADLPQYRPTAAPAPFDQVAAIVDGAAEKPQVKMMYEPGRVPCSWHVDSRYGFVDGCPACLIANDTTAVLAAVQ